MFFLSDGVLLIPNQWKNSLKGWSSSRRSVIWWSWSFGKIGPSEITGCYLGNLVSLTDHCDLVLICEVDITSHLISETLFGPSNRYLMKWNRTICPCVTSFFPWHVFRVHPCCALCQNFLPFWEWLMFLPSSLPFLEYTF